MTKLICKFNNLLYLSFQLKKYLWNYFSTCFWSIFPDQVKVSRQKAYLKRKHELFCNNFLSHLYVCTASSCQLRLQKVSSVHLKPETQGWFLKLRLYILYFCLKKYFDGRRFIDTKRFLPNYLFSHKKVQLALCLRFSHSLFCRVGEGVNFALTFVPKKKVEKKGKNLNHASSNQFHVTKI